MLISLVLHGASWGFSTVLKLVPATGFSDDTLLGSPIITDLIPNISAILFEFGD